MRTEVRTITTDLMRTAYESMTKHCGILELLSEGIVQGISTIVQPTCEDPAPF